jgi:hypothetical protein
MLSRKSAAADLLTLSPTVTDSTANPDHHSLVPLFETETPVDNQMKPDSATQNLLSIMFEARDVEISPDSLTSALQNQFIAMAFDLHEDGWFNNNNNMSLCLLDFEPRKILIDPTRDPDRPIVSGILDLDGAVLAPSFMACALPMWLLAWADDEVEDERKANDVPSSEEGRALKKIFEDTAGPEFVRYAYPPSYRLARRPVRFAINGIRSNEDVNGGMLREWEVVRHCLKAPAA